MQIMNEDVADIHQNIGHHYDEGIQEALASAKQLGSKAI